MSDFQNIRDARSERMRLIRFRMRRENLRFRDELRLIPRSVVLVVLGLFLIAQIVVQVANAYHQVDLPAELTGGGAVLALMGMVTAVAIPLACLIFLVAYVNRDAKRRGMHVGLWTLVVIMFLPAWFFVGFVIYFLVREPLPYHCTQCGSMVNARFNYCPTCRYNLRPTCQHCQQEVGELDRYCPHCGNTVTPRPQAQVES
jgi:double zinc ribbon protein